MCLIVLAAKQPDWWIYYALMATARSVIGNYLTYRAQRREEKRWSRAVAKEHEHGDQTF